MTVDLCMVYTSFDDLELDRDFENVSLQCVSFLFIVDFVPAGPAAAPQQSNMMQPPTVACNVELGSKNGTLGNKKVKSKDKDKDKDKDKGKKLTKADIGAPSEFRSAKSMT